MNSKSRINIKLRHIFLVFLFVGFLIYANVLHGEFQFDDRPFILENESIKDISNLREVFYGWGVLSRAIPFLTFALNYHFSGTDPFVYHVVNVLIHIINSTIVYLLAQLILSCPNLIKENFGSNARVMAFSAALIFLTHPLQTQAVSYISQRIASLAALFYLISMYLFLKARLASNNKKLFIFAGISGAMAMLSKEIAFSLPIMIFMSDYCLVLNEDQRRKFSEKVPWPYFTLFFFILIVPMFWNFDVNRIFPATYRIAGNSDLEGVTSMSYFFTQCRVIPYYLWLFIYPLNLNFDYHFPLSYSLLEPDVLMGLFFILIILYLAIRFGRLKPLYAFCSLWFFIALLVEASVIPIPHVIFEHRMYLPSFGLSLLFVALFFKILQNKALIIAILFCICGTLSLLTYERNKVWQTEIALWSDVVKKSPGKSRPYDNLAAALIEEGKVDEAKPYLLEALKRNPNNAKTKVNLAQIYVKQNNTAKAKAILLEILKEAPAYVDALNNLAHIYIQDNNYKDAEPLLRKAMDNSKPPVEVFLNLARLYEKTARLDMSLEVLEKSIKDFDDERAHSLRFQILLDAQRIGEARKLLKELRPESYSWLFVRNLGSLCASNGLTQEAFLLLSLAIKKSPRIADGYVEFGKLLANNGKLEEAIEIWQEGRQMAGSDKEFLELIEAARRYQKAL